MNRGTIGSILAAAALGLFGAQAAAQGYPAKAITLICPWPAGGSTLEQFDQVYCYKSGEDYAKWAAETYKTERATIERVGLLVK